MKALRPLLAVIAGGVLVLLVSEALLRFLPGTKVLVTNDSPGAYPLRPYLPGQKYRYSFGWNMRNEHSGETNNYGQIAPFDFARGSKPVLVLGDSYIESLMNSYESTLQASLGRKLGARDSVYGVGVSAMSFSDYGMLVSAARREFAPSALVVVVTDGDIVESLKSRQGGFFLRSAGNALSPQYVPRQPNRLVAALRARVGSPAVYDYLRGNLKFSPSSIWDDIRSAGRKMESLGSSRAASPDSVRQQFDVVDWFIEALGNQSGVEKFCIALLFDSDRYAMYGADAPAAIKDSPAAREHLMNRSAAAGFKVVDLLPVFEGDYRQNGLKFDFWPEDRHWNARGHELAAKAAFDALFGHRSSGPRCSFPPNSAE